MVLGEGFFGKIFKKKEQPQRQSVNAEPIKDTGKKYNYVDILNSFDHTLPDMGYDNWRDLLVQIRVDVWNTPKDSDSYAQIQQAYSQVEVDIRQELVNRLQMLKSTNKYHDRNKGIYSKYVQLVNEHYNVLVNELGVGEKINVEHLQPHKASPAPDVLAMEQEARLRRESDSEFIQIYKDKSWQQLFRITHIHLHGGVMGDPLQKRVLKLWPDIVKAKGGNIPEIHEAYVEGINNMRNQLNS